MLLAVNADKITVIILCIAALIFVLLDIHLVFSLHRHNKRLAKKSESNEENETHSKEDESPHLPPSENSDTLFEEQEKKDDNA